MAALGPDWGGYLEFREQFEGVIDPRLYSMAWLDGRVLDGSAMFARSENAAALFEVRSYPTGFREVHGLIAAGDLGELVADVIPAVEQWAKANGCQGAVIESRAGWAKAMRNSGYTVHQVAVRKDL